MQHILFLCTGNSARSIMAEAYMNHAGRDRWRAWSAGSKPVGAPNPFAIETLKAHDIFVPSGDEAPASKSWNDFTRNDAPAMDVILTVCDSAAAETCPIWPTRNGANPEMRHWSFPDPAGVKGADQDKRDAFDAVFSAIKERLDDFLNESQS